MGLKLDGADGFQYPTISTSTGHKIRTTVNESESKYTIKYTRPWCLQCITEVNY